MASFLDRALEHVPVLLRAARRLTRTPHEAEDLVQDTLVRALEKQDELRDREKIRPWLLAIERTVHLNGRRGMRAKLEVLEGGLATARPHEPTGDLEAEILAGSLDDRLDAAIAALPPTFREVLWLREVEGMSYEEIAVAEACPVGTVRSRLARAREMVASELEGKEEKSWRAIPNGATPSRRGSTEK